MAPKPTIVYSRERSKFVAPSRRFIVMSDDEQNPEYVPPGTPTPKLALRDTRGTPKKVAPGVVTNSKYDEAHTPERHTV